MASVADVASRAVTSDGSPRPAYSLRRLTVLLTTATAVFALDHFTKWLISTNLALGAEVPRGAPVALHHAENAGAAFGLFPQFHWIYLVVALLVSAWLLIAGPRMEGGLFRQVLLGGILGGAIANGIDRAIFGRVTDFIDFHFWPIFNVADMAIVGGMLLTVLIVSIHKPVARQDDQA